MKIPNLGSFVLALAVVAACGAEGGDDTTTVATDEPEVTTTADTGQEGTTTTGATATTEAMDTTTSAAEAMDGVHAMETDLGMVLVDPDGLTLYVFTQDSDGESACYDACAESWPPVAANTPISLDLDDSLFGSIERTDGTTQLTINGMPLYLFASDTGPGDTNGHGVNDVWFTVDADGNLLEASAAAQQVAGEGEAVAYDYDY
jgi:predicted lipoprotein with Yx(FWY)xxD motif